MRPLRAIQQIQLGTVLSSERQARETLRELVSAGYEGIELNGFMTRPTPLLVRAMTRLAGMPAGRAGRLDWPELVAESALTVVALHEDLGTIERESDAVVRHADELGTRTIVVTGMYRFDYSDAAHVSELARRLNLAGGRLVEAGLGLLYHNHNAELARVAPGRTAYDLLLDATDPAVVGFELDAYWLATAGADPVATMRRVGERVRLLHLTDRGIRRPGRFLTPIVTADSVELGDGNMPIAALLDEAVGLNVKAVVVETHRNWVDRSPLASARRSAAYLTTQLEESTCPPDRTA